MSQTKGVTDLPQDGIEMVRIDGRAGSMSRADEKPCRFKGKFNLWFYHLKMSIVRHDNSSVQIAGYLIKANSRFFKNGSGRKLKIPQAIRRKESEQIKADFLDFEEPMEPGDFIVPEEKKFEKIRIDERPPNASKMKSAKASETCGFG